MASGGEIRNAMKTAFKFRRIPDKWKDYTPCGKTIPGERLVSFKTPLSQNYHYKGEGDHEDSLQKDEEFTPSDLCETIRKNSGELGLVVDFTNTKRYYDPKPKAMCNVTALLGLEELTRQNIEYKKIKCEGKIVPPEKVVNRFKAAILSFFKRFPTSKSLVGVHCTHGLNRAGYIVCRYLIECKGYAPDKAIEAFNEARGHEMERENYIEDLKKRKPSLLSEVDMDALLEVSNSSEEEIKQRSEHWEGRRRRNAFEYRGWGPVHPDKRRHYNSEPYPYHRPLKRNQGRQRSNDETYERNYDHRRCRDRNREDFRDYHENYSARRPPDAGHRRMDPHHNYRRERRGPYPVFRKHSGYLEQEEDDHYSRSDQEPWQTDYYYRK